MALEPADGGVRSIGRRAGGALAACLSAVWYGRADERRLQRAGAVRRPRLARGGAAAGVARYLRQAAIPFAQALSCGRRSRHPAIAAALVRAVHRPLRSGRARRGGSGRRHAARIETALEAVAQPRRGPHHPPLPQRRSTRWCAPISSRPTADGEPPAGSASSSIRSGSRACRSRGRSARSSSTRRRSRACICASARWRAAACAGRTAPQDFRTEVLGLVKAQQVKNAVIVPVGAKGGFVPQAAAARAAPRRDLGEGDGRLPDLHRQRCSTSPTIIDGDAVVPPPRRRAPRRRRSLSRRRRRQGHATFSDTANAISRRRTASGSATPSPAAARPATTTRRWASPPAAPGRRSSAISARWTSTSRRRPSPSSASATCRATCSATACCCRRRLRLVAAFDHRDIFIDPDPDPAASLAERQRLFALPRSSWQDYDKAKISAGGGVVLARREVDPAVAARCRPLLGLAGDRGDARRGHPRHPQGARSTCCGSAASAPIVEGTGETDAEVGDRANDAIRITAAAIVRAKVVGEGANLGMTQRARIEYRPGRRPLQFRRHRQFGRRQHLRRRGQHQDRAGRRRCAKGRSTRPARNKLLDGDDRRGRRRWCCRNNYQQTLAISLAERARPRRFRAPEPLHGGAGSARPARSRRGDAAVDGGAWPSAQAARQAADPGRARRAARLRQDRAVFRRSVASDVAGRAASRPRADRAISRSAWRRNTPPRSTAIACGARSSPACVANAMINRGGPTYLTRVPTAPARRRARWRAPIVAVRERLRAARSQRRDRRARQQDRRRHPAHALSRGAGSADLGDGVVPAQ